MITLVSPQRPELQDQVKAEIALGTLPRTPWGIAHRLEEFGIHGEKNNPRHCPIAVYLKRNGVRQPVVRTHRTTIGNWHDIENSWGLKWFITMFDHGFFNYLRH